MLAGGGFVGGYGENVVELGEGQHLFGVVGGVDEDHLAAAAAELGEQRHQHADAGAIDVADFGEVDGALVERFAEVLVDGLQQLVGVGAADEVAGEANEEDAVLNGAGGGHAGVAGAGGGLGAAVAADAVKI